MLATFSSSKTLNPLASSDSSLVLDSITASLSTSEGIKKDLSAVVRKLQSAMVSLRRRKFLGHSSGNSYFLTLVSDHETASENASHCIKLVRVHPFSSEVVGRIGERSTLMTGSVNASGSSLSNEQTNQTVPGLPMKMQKRHKRKHFQNQKPCLMRGVYFKNMKWQAAIKVDKKQIHLGTVGSQEEAAHLYDRAAFMCGREPNFKLSEEEKKELSRFKWDEFLAVTRHAFSRKKPTSHRKATKLPI